MAKQVVFRNKGLARAALRRVERELGIPARRFGVRVSKRGRVRPKGYDVTGYALLCVSPDGRSFGFVMEPRDHEQLAQRLGLPELTDRTERWEGADAEEFVE